MACTCRASLEILEEVAGGPRNESFRSLNIETYVCRTFLLLVAGIGEFFEGFTGVVVHFNLPYILGLCR